MGKRQWRYFLVLMLVNLMWAFQYSGARIATRKLGPIQVTFLPLVFATLILGIILWAGGQKGDRPSTERGSFGGQLLCFVLLGTSAVVAQLGLVAGVKRTLASNASVITLTIPVMTALLATILVGEKIGRLLWISFPIAIIGVLILSEVNLRKLRLLSGNYLVGNALVLVGCSGSAFSNAYSKRLLRIFTPLEILVYSLPVTGALLFIAMQVWEPVSWKQLQSAGFSVWVALGFIALFSLTAAMLLFFWVIKRIDLTKASLSFYLLPVFGVLISAVVLKEKITGHLLVGGLLVLIATFLATTHGEHQRASKHQLDRSA